MCSNKVEARSPNIKCFLSTCWMSFVENNVQRAYIREAYANKYFGWRKIAVNSCSYYSVLCIQQQYEQHQKSTAAGSMQNKQHTNVISKIQLTLQTLSICIATNNHTPHILTIPNEAVRIMSIVEKFQGGKFSETYFEKEFLVSSKVRTKKNVAKSNNFPVMCIRTGWIPLLPSLKSMTYTHKSQNKHTA